MYVQNTSCACRGSGGDLRPKQLGTEMGLELSASFAKRYIPRGGAHFISQKVLRKQKATPRVTALINVPLFIRAGMSRNAAETGDFFAQLRPRPSTDWYRQLTVLILSCLRRSDGFGVIGFVCDFCFNSNHGIIQFPQTDNICSQMRNMSLDRHYPMLPSAPDTWIYLNEVSISRYKTVRKNLLRVSLFTLKCTRGQRNWSSWTRTRPISIYRSVADCSRSRAKLFMRRCNWWVANHSHMRLPPWTPTVAFHVSFKVTPLWCLQSVSDAGKIASALGMKVLDFVEEADFFLQSRFF